MSSRDADLIRARETLRSAEDYLPEVKKLAEGRRCHNGLINLIGLQQQLTEGQVHLRRAREATSPVHSAQQVEAVADGYYRLWQKIHTVEQTFSTRCLINQD